MNNLKLVVYITSLCMSLFLFASCRKEEAPLDKNAVGMIIQEEQNLTPPPKTAVVVIMETAAPSPLPSPADDKPASPSPKPVREIDGIIALEDLDASLVIDLKYSTTDNFTGKKVYPVAIALLQRETAEKLVRANAEFRKTGHSIKIWDAYRPPYVQQIFWDMVKDDRFVANPAIGGSKHNRGTAVDITLVDADGKELKMPSKFDDFSGNAYRSNPKMDPEAKKNMDYLTDVMKRNGFITISTEWWHFEDSNYAKYKIVDVNLDEFLAK